MRHANSYGIVSKTVAAFLVFTMLLPPTIGNRVLVAMFTPATAYAQPINTTTVTYTYDNNGNMVTRSAGAHLDTFTYDAENRLISANIQSGPNPAAVSYAYDADGMRISKTAGGITTGYLVDKNRDYAQVVTETVGSDIATFTYGHRLINQTRSSIGTHFVLPDGQMSTRHLTSIGGSVTDNYTYDAFGIQLSSNGSSPNLYLYGGEQLDRNLDLYYLRARYYNQFTGRFLTTDPEQGRVFAPVSLHRYLFADGDPINNSDPTGRMTLSNVVMLIAVLSGVGSIYAGFTGNERLNNFLIVLDATLFLATLGAGLLVKQGVVFAGKQAVQKGAVEAAKAEADDVVEMLAKSQISTQGRVLARNATNALLKELGEVTSETIVRRAESYMLLNRANKAIVGEAAKTLKRSMDLTHVQMGFLDEIIRLAF